jgi:hypothetical protein
VALWTRSQARRDRHPGFAVKVRLILPPAIALAALAVLSGCSAPVRAAELVGTYHDDDGLRPLVLRQDGTCAARLLPAGSQIVTGTCRWSLRQHDGADVRLDFHRDPHAGAYFVDFQVRGSGTNATLSQVTDPDLQHRYELRR